MPSQQTRVNLTLPEDVIAILDRISKATGAGRATIIREWLIGAAPQFREMAHAIELAQTNQIDAFKVIADTLTAFSETSGQMALDIKKTRRAAMRKRIQ